MNKKTAFITALTFATMAAFMLGPATAAGIKNFRDCKNITDALRLNQIKKKGMLSKEFLAKAAPFANKMMEYCADGKYTEAEAARKELEKVTGPIKVTSQNGPGRGPAPN